ncbi:MAG TPA: hypothetical protein VF316_07245 [Polyangiaceae bacterium]
MAIGACADIDTSRALPQRGTIGEEVYGIFCDRIAADELREDMTGASFRNVCHKVNGAFADKVDESLLPAPTSDAVDAKGAPVTVEKQQQDRARALARIGALVRRRGDLVTALDATIPDVKVPVKDLGNADPYKTCDAPQASGEDKLGRQVADMMARFTELYKDGTLPQSTESLAELLAAIEGSPDAQAALARVAARLGYRPVDTSLGAARPAVAYPRLRDLANATLRVISADSNPYDPNPKLDADGVRIPEPGPASAQFAQVLAVMQQELRTVQPDPASPALVLVADPLADRSVLSRPRNDLEAMADVMIAENSAFGGGTSSYIVRRDRRGFANVARVNGLLPSPFVDKDADGLADTDPLGRFVSSTGNAPASPFFAVGAPQAATYDTFDRSVVGGGLLYDYVDTSHTFTASMMGNLKPLVNPDITQKHESLMYMLGGAYALMGSRDGFPKTNRVYGDSSTGGAVTVTYDAFHPETSPVVDLVYALGNLMGDPATDDTLEYTKILMRDHEGDVARLAGGALAFKAVSDKHPEASIPAKSTFWDEMIDIVALIAKEPGLLEDVLRSMGTPEAEQLGGIYSSYMSFKDHISYDRANINGPAYNFDTKSNAEMKTPVDRTKPDTGVNRSAFQKFLQAIHDTNGVTACNKQGAKVHAILGGINVTMPLIGSYGECEVFKIENLAKFYLDSIVGRGTLYLRNDTLRNGILGIGAATVGLMEQSSGITGFWDASGSKTLRPKPQFLARQVFFDLANDSPTSGTNYKTNHFLSDLMGIHSVGTIVCPEKILTDPVPAAPDASPDGMVHGLRQCADGDWLDQRDLDATMVWENFGFFTAMTPLITAFALHGKEDLLLQMMEVWYRHWADDKGTKAECDTTGNAKTNPRWCSQDGIVEYEPLLIEGLQTDILPALAQATRTLSSQTMAHCTTVDPTTHKCTATQTLDGVQVLSRTARSVVDPDAAKAIGLTDRQGNKTALRNDGTTNPQVTPIYLLTGALSGIDGAFAALAQQDPNQADRQINWRLGRSQLVDQFVRVQGTGPAAKFADPSVPKITPVLVDMVRAQMLARCPNSFAPPFTRCAWARDELANGLSDRMKGPLFATAMDLLDAIRKDDPARAEMEALLGYLVDAASQNDALAALLATSSDALQVLGDDTNLVPIFHAFAPALSPSTKDAAGHVVKRSLVDAQLALLARVAGKYVDGQGKEVCSREMDPNQILTQLLTRLVTPMKDQGGRATQTPLEVIVDVIADVNRTDPQRTDKLDAPDYAHVAHEVGDFLSNKERGLEQFYEIVRQGTQD